MLCDLLDPKPNPEWADGSEPSPKNKPSNQVCDIFDPQPDPAWVDKVVETCGKLDPPSAVDAKTTAERKTNSDPMLDPVWADKKTTAPIQTTKGWNQLYPDPNEAKADDGTSDLVTASILADLLDPKPDPAWGKETSSEQTKAGTVWDLLDPKPDPTWTDKSASAQIREALINDLLETTPKPPTTDNSVATKASKNSSNINSVATEITKNTKKKDPSNPKSAPDNVDGDPTFMVWNLLSSKPGPASIDQPPPNGDTSMQDLVDPKPKQPRAEASVDQSISRCSSQAKSIAMKEGDCESKVSTSQRSKATAASAVEQSEAKSTTNSRSSGGRLLQKLTSWMATFDTASAISCGPSEVAAGTDSMPAIEAPDSASGDQRAPTSIETTKMQDRIDPKPEQASAEASVDKSKTRCSSRAKSIATKEGDCESKVSTSQRSKTTVASAGDPTEAKSATTANSSGGGLLQKLTSCMATTSAISCRPSEVAAGTDSMPAIEAPDSASQRAPTPIENTNMQDRIDPKPEQASAEASVDKSKSRCSSRAKSIATKEGDCESKVSTSRRSKTTVASAGEPTAAKSAATARSSGGGLLQKLTSWMATTSAISCGPSEVATGTDSMSAIEAPDSAPGDQRAPTPIENTNMQDRIDPKPEQASTEASVDKSKARCSSRAKSIVTKEGDCESKVSTSQRSKTTVASAGDPTEAKSATTAKSSGGGLLQKLTSWMTIFDIASAAPCGSSQVAADTDTDSMPAVEETAPLPNANESFGEYSAPESLSKATTATTMTTVQSDPTHRRSRIVNLVRRLMRKSAASGSFEDSDSAISDEKSSNDHSEQQRSVVSECDEEDRSKSASVGTDCAKPGQRRTTGLEPLRKAGALESDDEENKTSAEDIKPKRRLTWMLRFDPVEKKKFRMRELPVKTPDDSSSESSSRKNTTPFLECNYDLNCTPLYSKIEEAQWNAVIHFLDTGKWPGDKVADPIAPKQQAMTWVNSVDCKDKTTVRSSRLPLHMASICGAPFPVMARLVEIYSEAVCVLDEHGMLPIHLALRHGALESTVDYLLMSYPESADVKDSEGSTPIEYAMRKEGGVRSKMLQLKIKKAQAAAVLNQEKPKRKGSWYSAHSKESRLGKISEEKQSESPKKAASSGLTKVSTEALSRASKNSTTSAAPSTFNPVLPHEPPNAVAIRGSESVKEKPGEPSTGPKGQSVGNHKKPPMDSRSLKSADTKATKSSMSLTGFITRRLRKRKTKATVDVTKWVDDVSKTDEKEINSQAAVGKQENCSINKTKQMAESTDAASEANMKSKKTAEKVEDQLSLSAGRSFVKSSKDTWSKKSVGSKSKRSSKSGAKATDPQISKDEPVEKPKPTEKPLCTPKSTEAASMVDANPMKPTGKKGDQPSLATGKSSLKSSKDTRSKKSVGTFGTKSNKSRSSAGKNSDSHISEVNTAETSKPQEKSPITSKSPNGASKAETKPLEPMEKFGDLPSLTTGRSSVNSSKDIPSKESVGTNGTKSEKSRKADTNSLTPLEEVGDQPSSATSKGFVKSSKENRSKKSVGTLGTKAKKSSKSAGKKKSGSRISDAKPVENWSTPSKSAARSLKRKQSAEKPAEKQEISKETNEKNPEIELSLSVNKETKPDDSKAPVTSTKPPRIPKKRLPSAPLELTQSKNVSKMENSDKGTSENKISASRAVSIAEGSNPADIELVISAKKDKRVGLKALFGSKRTNTDLSPPTPLTRSKTPKSLKLVAEVYQEFIEGDTDRSESSESYMHDVTVVSLAKTRFPVFERLSDLSSQSDPSSK